MKRIIPRRGPVNQALVTLAILVAGCSGGQSAGTTPTQTAPLAPAVAVTPIPSATVTEKSGGQPRTFMSAAYGYSVLYPAGWSAIGATRQLKDFEFPEPLGGTPSDRFTRHPDRDPAPLIIVAAQPLAAGTTLQDWTASVLKIIYPHLDCNPDSHDSVSVGGEPATLLTYGTCPGVYALWTALVHANMGFHIVMTTDPSTGLADQVEYARLLDTMTFAP